MKPSQRTWRASFSVVVVVIRNSHPHLLRREVFPFAVTSQMQSIKEAVEQLDMIQAGKEEVSEGFVQSMNERS
jgi:hypothetical protein